MARETYHLLIGEAAIEEEIKEVEDILSDFDELESFGNIRSMHLGPNQIMLGAYINFKDNYTVAEIEPVIEKIKQRILEVNPDIKYFYLETNSFVS